MTARLLYKSCEWLKDCSANHLIKVSMMRWLLARFQASGSAGPDVRMESLHANLSVSSHPASAISCVHFYHLPCCDNRNAPMPRVFLFLFVCLFSLSLFQIQEASPALKAGLEPFFDFILSIGNTRLVSAPTLCVEMLLFTLQVLAIN